MFHSSVRIVLAALAIAAGTARAQTVKLTGIVMDEHGVYVPNVDLSLQRGNRTEATARSGDGGQFEFSNVAPGTVTIVARRLGYSERQLGVEVKRTPSQQSVQIDLETVPADLDKVVVEDSPGRLQEFIEHRKASKFGYFYDQNQIHTKNPRYLSEMFRTIPGARLEAVAGGGNKLLLRGCKPKIWLDGVQAQYAEIDEVIAPSEIAGLEIYPSWAGIPAQYMDRENRACGVVIIWSRQS